MFMMEILQEIVINVSFDMIKTFAAFSGHTLSVKVQTNHRLKLLNNIRYMGVTSGESLLLFYCNADNFNVKHTGVSAIN